jgi:ribonuclease HII
LNESCLYTDNSDIITGCIEFRYLGTIFTKDGKDNKHICHRVTQARKIIGALHGVRWSKNITRNRKKMIYNSMVKSALIYGAETCSLYEDDRRRIDVTEMDALRQSARISKIDRKTNEYNRGKIDAQDMILDDITRKKNLFGMVMSRE